MSIYQAIYSRRPSGHGNPLTETITRRTELITAESEEDAATLAQDRVQSGEEVVEVARLDDDEGPDET